MKMITDADIQRYAELNTSPEPEYLQRINRDTHAQVLSPRMLSGHYQGRLLRMISLMIRPQSILEIGTYTGYSALCLAEGLAPGGKIITIDINEELENRVRKNFSASPFASVIEFICGDARKIIPGLNINPDLVFIDADKKGYAEYYNLILPKLRPGGWILVDNVLWDGKVTEENPDTKTRIILDFNKMIAADERVEKILIPIRDGLTLIRKVRD
jgi:caffeoyl-CoA O-methyltransferase